MLEPIFIPKLQIYFAEFPYLDYFNIFVIKQSHLMRYRYGLFIDFLTYYYQNDDLITTITS